MQHITIKAYTKNKSVLETKATVSDGKTTVIQAKKKA